MRQDNRSRRRRAPRWLPVAIVGTAVTVWATGTATALPGDKTSTPTSQPASDSLEAQREAAQAMVFDATAEIDRLTTSGETLRKSLTATAGSVKRAERELWAARQEADDAARQQAEAKSTLARLQIESQQIDQRMRAYAVAAYVAPQTFDNVEVVSSADPTATLRRKTFAAIASGTDHAALESFRARRQDVEFVRKAAKSAETRWRESQDEAAQKVKKLEKAQSKQRQQLEQLGKQIDELAVSAEEWRGVDAKLTKKIDERNTKLVEFLAAQEAAANAAAAKTAAAQAARDAAKKSSEGSSKGTGSSKASADGATPTTSKKPSNGSAGKAPKGRSGSGSGSGTVATTVPVATTGGYNSTTPTIGDGTPLPPGDPRWAYAVPGYPPPPAEWKAPAHLISVEETEIAAGFRVKSSIAPQVRRMVADAAADGVVLSGWAYRPFPEQVRLRSENCGRSQMQIWVNRSTTCKPPVAVPGQSRHQNGVAIDFNLTVKQSCVGKPKPCTASPVFDWLVANAAKYGFYNYPVEPWHWSIDGN